MRRTIAALFIAIVAVTPLLALDTTTIVGDYLEVRTSDVYTGPCFANGEVNLVGKEAILAWRVRSGSLHGVDLRDMSVVAVVKANATLGDPFSNPEPAKAVLVIDQRASDSQRTALASLARSMAGPLLKDVVLTESAPIELEVDGAGDARMQAGLIAGFSTRRLNHSDHLCGNEIVYYPPLVDAQATPAYAKTHWFRGDGLKQSWSSPFKRSAFVGSFSLDASAGR